MISHFLKRFVKKTAKSIPVSYATIFPKGGRNRERGVINVAIACDPTPLLLFVAIKYVYTTIFPIIFSYQSTVLNLLKF